MLRGGTARLITGHVYTFTQLLKPSELFCVLLGSKLLLLATPLSVIYYITVLMPLLIIT